MRATLFLISIILFSTDFLSQVCYEYDAAGNRTARTILCAGIANNDEDDKKVGESKPTEELILVSKVYPNPSYGILNVELPGDANAKIEEHYNSCIVYIMSQDGRLIYNKAFQDRKFQIDICDQAAGIYIVKLKFEELEESWQIIKN